MLVHIRLLAKHQPLEEKNNKKGYNSVSFTDWTLSRLHDIAIICCQLCLLAKYLMDLLMQLNSKVLY